MPDPIARFWDKYIEKLINYGIKPDKCRWYVKHTEDYIKFYEGKRLRHHSSDDVNKYLEDKGRKPYLKDWQFRQHIVALKVLFVDLLNLEWVNSVHWDDLIIRTKELAVDHETIAIDKDPE